MPGDHVADGSLKLPEDPDLLAKLFLSIEGCGPASHLSLRGADLSWMGLRSVRLAHFALELDDRSFLTVGKVEEVAIEGCSVSFPSRRTAALRLSATRSVRLADNDIESVRDRGDDRRSKAVFAAEPELGALFGDRPSREEFAKQAKAVGVKLTKLSAAKRRELAEAISQALAQLKQKLVASGEAKAGEELPGEAAYRNLIAVLPRNARTLEPELSQALADLRGALAADPSSLAVTLEFEGGDVTLVDNRIGGTLTFYGSPGQAVLSNDQLERLRDLIAERALRFEDERAELHLVRNRFGGPVRIGGDRILELREIADDSRGTVLAGVFGNVRATDNRSDYYLELLGADCNLSGNFLPFTQDGLFRLALVVADEAFYVGNHGSEDDDERVGIYDLARRTNKGTRGDLNSVRFVDF